ncbi:glycoside hydrolase domain-containing protein [Nocardioides sp. GXZ039]|uniref:glycoside hydrolase domain-containing protein n=1 Tax=Nocardioides sp. GXZ039 TaxID=3136018 RepID=UPI0030F37E79
MSFTLRRHRSAPTASRRSATARAVSGLATLSAIALTLGVTSVTGPASAAPAERTLPSASPALTAGIGERAADPLPPTPGDFTGYGFDQCLAPSQSAMDAWLRRSPFLAVGIYISGDSRACRSQPNLTPQWIRTQLLKGWRLLPITLGPQASCQPRFPRYSDDFKISPVKGKAGNYGEARKMARDSAASTVADARALGIPAGSTLWYDLEGFDITNTACRESALAFLSTWVTNVRRLGYVTGVYSSAGSGIKALDDARVNRPGSVTLPDRIWVARWDGVANTSTSYLRPDGWMPGGRVKQYRGGHDEVWGKVRINIDSNFLDLGRGSVAPPENHCGGVQVNFGRYGALKIAASGESRRPGRLKALQCLLTERGYFRGQVTGKYSAPLLDAVRRWKAARGQATGDTWYPRDWMTLHGFGSSPVLKVGSAGPDVRRVQRAINSANIGTKVPLHGTYDATTAAAVKTYQRRLKMPATGIVDGATWGRIRAGAR